MPSQPLFYGPAKRANQQGQIYFHTHQGILYLHLPDPKVADVEWSQLWEQLQKRLSSGQHFWPPKTCVYLVANDRLLDHRQLQQLGEALQAADLHLLRICTSRRQTAVVAVTAGYSVDQQSPDLPLANKALPKLPKIPDGAASLVEPLYLQTTLRSGSEIRHPGAVVVVGDLNPGSAVIADGDIVVWGRLRGIAHAGANGDLKARIMALQMEPTQLRIATQVARAPSKKPNQLYPEVAYIAPEGIRIMQAAEFAKLQGNSTVNG